MDDSSSHALEKFLNRQWLNLIVYLAITAFVINFCAGRSFFEIVQIVMRFHYVGSMIFLALMTLVTIATFHLKRRITPRFDVSWIIYAFSLASHFLFVTACLMIVRRIV